MSTVVSSSVSRVVQCRGAKPLCVTGRRLKAGPRATLPVPSAVADVLPAQEPAQNNADMFCYQCEQTAHGTGCTTVGVCGKDSDLAALQDLLVYALKGVAAWAAHAREINAANTRDCDAFIAAALFATMTNVNFDDDRFKTYLIRANNFRRELQASCAFAGNTLHAPEASQVPWLGTDMIAHPIDFDLFDACGSDPTLADMIAFGHRVGIVQRLTVMGNATLVGLQELLTYGLKGMCAYAHHAQQLGYEEEEVYVFVRNALTFLCTPAAADGAAVLDWCLKFGECNLRVMALLDKAHNELFGVPTPTEVPLYPTPGKCILVSGHDLRDTYELLEQTEGTGINVYTHGELLPAHAYPNLKRRFPHLVANYGGAWYAQKKDFAKFPGAILMTTNCVLQPPQSYAANLFTTGEVGVSAGNHIAGDHPKDFSAVIRRALELPGFTAADVPAEKKTVMVGFGHKTVLGVADKVLDAIAAKQLNHIFLVGGCDGFEASRKYYSDLHSLFPQDSIVLTLGCGKFRIYDKDFGNLPQTELPRLMDMGQCNDAYSAIVVAVELSKALGCGVNDLPLSLDISWFEQKAVAVLLTLLHLGVKNIRLGPRLPAFLTPDAVKLLVDTYQLAPADTAHPEKDVEAMLAGH